MTFERYDIPDGFRGTEETIRRMHELTTDAYKDPRVVALAREIVYAMPWKNYANEVSAILAWCQANLRYVRDPVNVEHLQHPLVTIFETRSGDCDELSPAFSALAAAVGNPWGFRTVGNDPMRPTHFVHVYSLVSLGGNWLPADPTFQSAPLGWEPPAADLSRLGVPQPNAVSSRRDWFPAKYE